MARLRRILLLISGLVFIMTLAELTFLAHWTEAIQYLPFVLSGLGLLALALAYFQPNPQTTKLLSWSMWLIGICSLIGVYEHMINNYAFRMEIAANSTFPELIKATLEGANPVLAPGILALGAMIGLAAVYNHPDLRKS